MQNFQDPRHVSVTFYFTKRNVDWEMRSGIWRPNLFDCLDFLEYGALLATGKIAFLVLRYTAQLCMRKCRLEDLHGKFKDFSLGLFHSPSLKAKSK
jgi:hypothetical protein